MTKLQLIRKVASFHPDSDAGIKRGWSYYTGGMADSGNWFVTKLFDASKKDLEICLNDLIEEHKPKPEPVYTEEEQRQMSNIILLPDGKGFITEYMANSMRNMYQKLEHDIFFGGYN